MHHRRVCASLACEGDEPRKREPRLDLVAWEGARLAVVGDGGAAVLVGEREHAHAALGQASVDVHVPT